MSDQIEWSDFAAFVRQLSHDVRNQLNAAELQAALVNELTTDAELKGEVGRLRRLISQMGTTLQQLSSAVGEPRPSLMPYRAGDFLEDLQKKITQKYPEQANAVKWELNGREAQLEIDPILWEGAMLELFDNAFRHGGKDVALTVESAVEGNEFALALREENSAGEDGRAWDGPLRKVSHGHYGLGRHRVKAIVTAQGGRFETERRGGAVFQRIALPCSSSRE